MAAEVLVTQASLGRSSRAPTQGASVCRPTVKRDTSDPLL